MTTSSPTPLWQANVADELGFWQRLASGEMPEKLDDWRARFDPGLPIQEYVLTYLPEEQRPMARILDVGAGPATTLGKTWQGHRLDLTAVDPLAEGYGAMLAATGWTPPVATRPCAAEELTTRCGSAAYDLVYSRNALDHAYDPLAAFDQLVAALKPGRSALVECFAREGEYEGYGGLHQWNFDVRGRDLEVWSREQPPHSLAQRFRGLALVDAVKRGDWIYCWLHRLPQGWRARLAWRWRWLPRRRTLFLAHLDHLRHPQRDPIPGR